MAARRFGALDLAATTDTVLMSGASGFDSTVNVRFTNRNSSAVTVRMALVDDVSGSALGSLSDEDYLEYDTTIEANDVLENTGLVIPEDHTIVVRSDTTLVTVLSYGFEEQIV